MEKYISAHSRHAALLLDVFRPLQVSCLQTMSFGSASDGGGGGGGRPTDRPCIQPEPTGPRKCVLFGI